MCTKNKDEYLGQEGCVLRIDWGQKGCVLRIDWGQKGCVLGIERSAWGRKDVCS